MDKTNPVTVLVVLLLIAAGWWGWTFGPLYYDHLEVKEAASQMVNLVPQVREVQDAITNPLVRLNTRVGWHYHLDEETGEESVQPGLGLTAEDNVELEVDEERRHPRVRIRYSRVVQLKPFQRRQRVDFTAEAKANVQ